MLRLALIYFAILSLSWCCLAISNFDKNLQNLTACNRTYDFFFKLSQKSTYIWKKYTSEQSCKVGHRVRHVNKTSVFYTVKYAENFTLLDSDGQNVGTRNIFDWEYDADDEVFDSVTPCIQFDSLNSKHNESVTVEMLSLIDPSNPHQALGYNVSVSKLNALNEGRGFAVGYKSTVSSQKYVHFRLILVQVGNPANKASYVAKHTAILNHLLDSSTSPFNITFLPGTGGPNNHIERNISFNHKTINLMHSGPDYFYTEMYNKYLFGVHVSSYKYSYPAIKHFAQTGGKTIAVAGRKSSSSLFFDTTCQYGLEYAESLGIKLAIPRITYDPDAKDGNDKPIKKLDPDFLKSMAEEICNSGADIYMLCVNHEEAKVLIDHWRAKGTCQPKGLWMTCTAWSQSKIESSDDYNYAFGAGQWHKSMTYGDEFFDNGQQIIDHIQRTTGVEVSYNAISGYAVPYLLSKLIIRVLQNKDLGDLSQKFVQETYLSKNNAQNYESMRRQLETLTIATSVYGPINFDENRRNNGRDPAASQILPPRDLPVSGGSSRVPFLDMCVAPLTVAEAGMVFPAPGQAVLCPAGSVFDMIKKNPPTCFMCEQCYACRKYRGESICDFDPQTYLTNADGSPRCLIDFKPASPRDDEDVIYYPAEQWASADILHEICAIIANEILGYKTEKVGTAQREAAGVTSTWTALAAEYGPNKGFDFHMELWVKSAEAEYHKYVNEYQTITPMSDTGYLAEEGWYVNSGTEGLSSKPLDIYRSYRSREVVSKMRPAHSTEQTVRANGKKGCDVEESVFAYPELAPNCDKSTDIWLSPACRSSLSMCPEFLISNVLYSANKVVLSQIKNFGLNFSVVYSSNYSHWQRLIKDTSKLTIMYGWRPDPFFSPQPLNRVSLPTYTTEKWNAPEGPTCDWQPETPQIGVNTDFLQKPQFHDFTALIEGLSFDNSDAKALMEAFGSVGGYSESSVRSAACLWLNENTEKWAKFAVDTRRPTLYVAVEGHNLVATIATELFVHIARTVLKYEVEIVKLSRPGNAFILKQLGLGVLDIVLSVDTLGVDNDYKNYKDVKQTLVDVGSLKLASRKGIFVAYDATKISSQITDNYVFDHYLGLMEDEVFDLLPPMNYMNRSEKVNASTGKLVADHNTYKFLNDEGQFIPKHCATGSALKCAEIYATDPYMVYRLGTTEELLQNFELNGKSLRLTLTYALEDSIVSLINRRSAQGKLTVFVSCMECPLYYKTKRFSRMVKFPHMSLSCEDALNVALSPLAKSVGTEFNCGFPQAMPRKLTSTVFQKKGRAVTHLAEKLMFDRGPRYAGSNIYKYVDMLKVAGGTETSAAKIAERFFEDDKELMMRDYVLTCSTVPGKIGVFGICEDCPAGKFSTGDSNVCKDCTPGYFQPQTGQSSCLKPSAGSYVPTNGSTQSLSCPVHSIAKLNDAEDPVPTACECTVGYVFLKDSVSQSRSCVTCPRGSKCYARGTTLTGRSFANIESAAGFWTNKEFYKDDQLDLQFWRCPLPKDGSACVGQTNETTDCKVGHDGPLCGSCIPGYAHTYFGECQQCDGGASQALTQLILLLIVVIVLVGGLFLKHQYILRFLKHVYDDKRLSSKKEKKNSKGTKKRSTTEGDTLGMKLKIALGYVQILSAFSQISIIKWSNSFNSLGSLASVVDFDVSNLHLLSCAATGNYAVKLVIITLWPLLLAACLAVYYCYTSRCYKLRNFQTKQTLGVIKRCLILMVLVLYPSISRQILRSFDCIQFSTKQKFLRYDLNISCMDSSYYGIIYYASFMTILYPVGIPIFIFMFLRRQYKKGNLYLEGSSRSELRPTAEGAQQYGVLYLGYEPSLYWWEAFDMFRRFCLTSLVNVFFSGETIQIVVAMIITFAFVEVQALAAPYLSDYDDFLQNVCQLSLFFVLFFGMLIAASSHDQVFWNRTGPKTIMPIEFWQECAFLAALVGILACLISVILWAVPNFRETVFCSMVQKPKKKDIMAIEVEIVRQQERARTERQSIIDNPLFGDMKKNEGKRTGDGEAGHSPIGSKQSKVKPKRLSVRRSSTRNKFLV